MTSEPTPIRIDIVSDVVCPWCIIGFRRLEEALRQLDGEVEVELHWHPFELNPMMPPEGQDLGEHITEKYGTDPKESPKARARMTRIGEEVGFSFDYFDDMRMVNTFRAHQLLHWAGEQAKKTELEMALFESFFSRRENVDDPAVLAEVAGRVGLDEAEAAKVIADGRYAGAVRERQRFWISKGIQAVPSFIFNGRYLIPGAQDPAVFVAALERLRDEPDEPSGAEASEEARG
jgi:predicted DsbA family dithiol-disulfide isomerase